MDDGVSGKTTLHILLLQQLAAYSVQSSRNTFGIIQCDKWMYNLYLIDSAADYWGPGAWRLTDAFAFGSIHNMCLNLRNSICICGSLVKALFVMVNRMIWSTEATSQFANPAA